MYHLFLHILFGDHVIFNLLLQIYKKSNTCQEFDLILLSFLIFFILSLHISCKGMQIRGLALSFSVRDYTVISPASDSWSFCLTMALSSYLPCRYISFVTIASTVESWPLITWAVFSWNPAPYRSISTLPVRHWLMLTMFTPRCAAWPSRRMIHGA